MKLVLVLTTLVVSTLALTDQQKESLAKITKPCKEQHNVPDEIVTKARNGEYVDDPRLKASFLCAFKKLGFADENGDLKNDALKVRVKAAATSDEETENVLKKCTVKKNTPEETVYEATRCLHKELPNYSPVE